MVKGLIVGSVAAAIVHFPFQSSVYIRGPFGALGLICAWFATGTALWAVVRMQDRRFWRVLVISLVPLAYWTWQLYEAVHGRYVTGEASY